METQTFIIKSLFVQDTIMLLSMGVLLSIFIVCLKEKKTKVRYRFAYLDRDYVLVLQQPFFWL